MKYWLTSIDLALSPGCEPDGTADAVVKDRIEREEKM
jgi:hypothetical protein